MGEWYCRSKFHDWAETAHCCIPGTHGADAQVNGSIYWGRSKWSAGWVRARRQGRLARRAGESAGDGTVRLAWIGNKEHLKHPDKSSSLKSLAGTMMLEFDCAQFEAQKRNGIQMFNQHLWMRMRVSNYMWYQCGNLASENQSHSKTILQRQNMGWAGGDEVPLLVRWANPTIRGVKAGVSPEKKKQDPGQGKGTFLREQHIFL